MYCKSEDISERLGDLIPQVNNRSDQVSSPGPSLITIVMALGPKGAWYPNRVRWVEQQLSILHQALRSCLPRPGDETTGAIDSI